MTPIVTYDAEVACLNAVGHEFQCSYMGANHGHGSDGMWFAVSETVAARWHEKSLACRLRLVTH